MTIAVQIRGPRGRIGFLHLAEEHAIRDASGRRWRFEWDDYMGPTVLRADGTPRSRQPGQRSQFWLALAKWRARQRARKPRRTTLTWGRK